RVTGRTCGRAGAGDRHRRRPARAGHRHVLSRDRAGGERVTATDRKRAGSHWCELESALGAFPPPLAGEGWGGSERGRINSSACPRDLLHAPSLSFPPTSGGGNAPSGRRERADRKG